MVQSLIAIWEELERLRLLEETKHPDLGRPSQEEALKSFLHGIKYESALSMLFPQEGSHHKVSTIEESERLERCFKSLTDIVGTVTFSQDDYCDNIGVGNSAGMQNEKENTSQSSNEDVHTISPERNSQHLVSSSLAQRTLSQLSDEGEKHVHAEALVLLSWLASSQAAEEPTTDDELINEVILSPLISKKSIEVTLKSAHLDFDSASQQECQDILDSVDPVNPAEEPTHTSFLGTVRPSSSLGSTIPQVDGSSDENPKVPQEYDKSKITKRTVGSPNYTSTKNSSKSDSKRAGTEHLWGSLPISSRKQPYGNADDSGSATQSLIASNNSTTEKNSHDTTGSTVKESSSFVGEDDSVSHSVRDLMRRRRSIRPVQLEFDSAGTAPCTMDKESEAVKSRGLEFHDFASHNSNSEMPYSRDEYLRMTFAQKPPIKNQVSSGFESPSGSEQHESAKMGLADLLPFFDHNMEENKQNESFQYTGRSEFSAGVLGVPTHFQNDGLALYLLTHALLPPSAVSVGHWLTQQSCSSNLKDADRVPADQVEEVSLTVSPNSPARSTGKNSTTKFAVDADEVESAQSDKESKRLDDWHDLPQISAGDEKDKLTPLSQIGFRDPASVGGGQQLTILSIEVLTESRGELRPDPRFDAINAVSLAIEDDADNSVEAHVFIRDNNDKSHRRRNLEGIAGCNVHVFPEERDLFDNLVSAVCLADPDILVGWEIQLGSLGFLAERAAHLGIGLLKRISRTPPHEMNHPHKNPVDESSQVLPEASSADDVVDDVRESNWSHTHASSIHVGGRIVLYLWRLCVQKLSLIITPLKL